MLELVTIAQAREHLRLDSDSDGGPDDAWLEMFIPAISASVANWLKDAWRLYEVELDSDGLPVVDSDGVPVNVLDSDGLPITLWPVRAAVLIELDRQYRFRGGEGTADVPADAGYGYTLGKGATALLTPLRRPTVA